MLKFSYPPRTVVLSRAARVAAGGVRDRSRVFRSSSSSSGRMRRPRGTPLSLRVFLSRGVRGGGGEGSRGGGGGEGARGVGGEGARGARVVRGCGGEGARGSSGASSIFLAERAARPLASASTCAGESTRFALSFPLGAACPTPSAPRRSGLAASMPPATSSSLPSMPRYLFLWKEKNEQR